MRQLPQPPLVVLDRLADRLHLVVQSDHPSRQPRDPPLDRRPLHAALPSISDLIRAYPALHRGDFRSPTSTK